MDPKVDAIIERSKKWKPELETLRDILLATPLTEDFKWRAPCYTYENKNIILVYQLKDCLGLSFLKGVLLSDPDGHLVSPGENSQSAMLLKFYNVKEITDKKNVIIYFINQAIANEQQGLKVAFKAKVQLVLCEEFQQELDKNTNLRKAFEALTPGKQRGYHLHISAAKQGKTKLSRIRNVTPKILLGKGFHDCTCGLSKRMPRCDGSHKTIKA